METLTVLNPPGCEAISRFQAFSGFSILELTGNGDFRTWSELLVSTGDPNRSGTAADMASTITAARATALVNAGYRTVGRYLTNYQLPGALDKNIKPGELTTILNAGLTALLVVVADLMVFAGVDAANATTAVSVGAARLQTPPSPRTSRTFRLSKFVSKLLPWNWRAKRKRRT
jgi:hypothetical protein